MNTESRYSEFSKYFYQSVDGATLGLFRLCWGVFILLDAVSRFSHISGMYSPEYFHFKYPLFTWVRELPEQWMLATELTILVLAALGVLLGRFFRTSCLTFALIYLHLFLTDEIYYNNYSYFTILISVLLACTGADKTFSMISYRSRDNEGVAIPRAVPFWNYILLRAQLGILYFYGGIAKLNGDWLHALPLKYWFQTSGSIRFPMKWFAEQDWFAWSTAYGGIFIELGAPILLLWRRSRLFAIVTLIGFHLMNSRLFLSGFTPFIAIVCIMLFLEPSRGRSLWGRFQKLVSGESRVRSFECSSPRLLRRKAKRRCLGIYLFVSYLSIQIILPLRAHMMSQNSAWTEVGNKFSWRMLLHNKDAYLKFRFSHPEAEAWLNENSDLCPLLASGHAVAMSKHPWMIHQYARELEKVLTNNGMANTKITVVSVVSLNGRPYQVMIDPTADLTDVVYPLWGAPDWIVPLHTAPSMRRRPVNREERVAAIMKALKNYAKTHPSKLNQKQIWEGFANKRLPSSTSEEKPDRVVFLDE
ncbi:MAG: HTTM domain-containing protein [Verrucomicrobia bacterium]|nr:HTTM domain-containing protein [Verrucomicrobiota bacterium]